MYLNMPITKEYNLRSKKNSPYKSAMLANRNPEQKTITSYGLKCFFQNLYVYYKVNSNTNKSRTTKGYFYNRLFVYLVKARDGVKPYSNLRI